MSSGSSSSSTSSISAKRSRIDEEKKESSDDDNTNKKPKLSLAASYDDPRKDCVVGVLECDGYDSISLLMRDYSTDYNCSHTSVRTQRKKYEIESDTSFYTYRVGCIEGVDFIVSIAIRYYQIDGYYVALWYPVSNCVDFDLCKNFVKEIWPTQQHSNFMNIHQVLHVIEDMKSKNIAPKKETISADEHRFQKWYNKEFLVNGEFSTSYMCYCVCATYDEKDAEKLARYKHVKEEFDKASKIIESIKPTVETHSERQMVAGLYKFVETDWIGRDLISITRPSVDGFYLTIGVQLDLETRKKIEKYCMVGTNGNLKDIQDAIEKTIHLF